MIHKYTVFTKPSEIKQIDRSAYFVARKKVKDVALLVEKASMQMLTVEDATSELATIFQAAVYHGLAQNLLNAARSYRIEEVMHASRFFADDDFFWRDVVNERSECTPFQISLFFFKKAEHLPEYWVQFAFDAAGNLKGIEYGEGSRQSFLWPRLQVAQLPRSKPWRKLAHDAFDN